MSTLTHSNATPDFSLGEEAQSRYYAYLIEERGVNTLSDLARYTGENFSPLRHKLDTISRRSGTIYRTTNEGYTRPWAITERGRQHAAEQRRRVEVLRNHFEADQQDLELTAAALPEWMIRQLAEKGA